MKNFRFKSFAKLSIMLMGASFLCVFFSCTVEGLNEYNQGVKYVNERQYEKALECFNKSIALDPNYYNAYNGRGYVYNHLAMYEEAIVDFTKAIELKGDEPDYYFNRGNAYTYLKKYDLAIKDYTRVIELDPQHKNGYSNYYCTKAIVLIDQGKREEALHYLNKAISIDPTFLRSYLLRFGICTELTEYDKAFNDINTFINLLPNDSFGYYMRGRCYVEDKKNYKMAIIDFNKAISIDPEDGEYYQGRAITHYNSGKKDEAKKDFYTACLKGDDWSCEQLEKLFENK